MLDYSEQEIKDITEGLLARKITEIRSVGNTILKRHQVYLIADELRNRMIIKLYYKQNRWNKEVASLRILADSDVLTPECLDYGCLDDGTEWVLLEYLEGEPYEIVKDQISPENRLTIMEEMGRQLAKIHVHQSFDFFGNWDEHGNRLVKVKRDYYTSFVTSREAIIKEVLEMHLPEEELQRRCAERLRQGYNLFADITNFSLCHHDFDGRNVLVKEIDGLWRVVGIIDFEHCYPDDFYKDIAGMYHTYFLDDGEYIEAMERSFLRGYQETLVIEQNFYQRLDYYLLGIGLGICSWAYTQAPDYYYSGGIRLLERFA